MNNGNHYHIIKSKMVIVYHHMEEYVMKIMIHTNQNIIHRMDMIIHYLDYVEKEMISYNINYFQLMI